MKALAVLLGAVLPHVACAAGFAVVGTGDGLEILRAVAQAYRAEYPQSPVDVPPSIGSGGAIAAIGANREKLGRVARPLTATEEASGIRYHPVFHIPSAFYVHPEVGVSGLSVDQLKAIFAGNAQSWKEFGGADIRLRVVRREESDSTLQVLRASIPAFRDLVFTERSKLALTTQDAVTSIRDNPGAIGFAPFSTDIAAQIRPLMVDGRAPNAPDYPARVTLALIYKADLADEEIRRFIGFFKSKTARDIVINFGARPID